MMGVKKSSSQKSFFIIFLSFVFLISWVCCSPKKEIIKKDEKEVLRDRINKYWEFIIKGTIDEAYKYEIPRYREKVPLIGYLNKFKLVRYMEADVLELEVNGNEGKALMRVKYRVLLKHISNIDNIRTVNEKWIKIEDVWYHVPEGF